MESARKRGCITFALGPNILDASDVDYVDVYDTCDCADSPLGKTETQLSGAIGADCAAYESYFTLSATLKLLSVSLRKHATRRFAAIRCVANIRLIRLRVCTSPTMARSTPDSLLSMGPGIGGLCCRHTHRPTRANVADLVAHSKTNTINAAEKRRAKIDHIGRAMYVMPEH